MSLGLKPQPAERVAAARVAVTSEVKAEEADANTAAAEAPLEEQNATIEADVKAIKGAKSSLLKAQLVALESELQVLREW